MSVATLRRFNGRDGIKGRRIKPTIAWKRPTDWLPLPQVNVGEQKLVGLYAVYNHDSNWISFSCTAPSGFTVNWGDGSALENFATGVIAGHQYSYASAGLGPVTSDGFKQAIVTVTPQAGNITILDLSRRHASSGTTQAYATGWLDLRVSGPFLISCLVSGTSPQCVSRNLRSFEFIGTNVITALSSGFANLTSLERVAGDGLIGASCTTLASCFSFCPVLRSLPAGSNTSNVLGWNGCFNGCSALETMPAWDTSKGNLFSTMFQDCASLKTIPFLVTGGNGATTFTSMFSGCSSLKTVPLIDTHLATGLSSMFRDCLSLITIPLLDTSANLNFSSMFSGCLSLQAVPLLNTAAGTNFATMFQTCPSLTVGALSGTRFAISYTLCRLSAAELDNIYTNLGAASGGAQTITVTTNPGVATDTPAIATAKGWTVTGT